MPAVERYSGPPFQVLRKYLRDRPSNAKQLDIYILSARFGLLHSQELIGDYDQKMTPTLARNMRRQVLQRVEEEILSKKYDEIFISMGKTYWFALTGLADMVSTPTALVISDEPAGKKLTALHHWLHGTQDLAPERTTEEIATPNWEPVTVVLRGREVNLTTAEAIDQLEKEITLASGVAHNVRKWYVDVAGKRLAPKWAVAVLFDIPVSEFAADEARRVLNRLGLNCRQT